MMGEGVWRLFGLNVSSEVPLPFAATASGSEPDVTVRLGTLPPITGGFARCGADALQFNASDAGSYRIIGGREIVVHPAQGAALRNVRLYLLGSAFGALLHQRGLLPLHANAIVIGGKAVAFMGRSGAGKSTLAAWFHDRGHAVLADDVSAVAAEAAGAVVFPGVPRLRLWRDALERSGRAADGFERSFEGRDKYDVPTPAALPTQPVALGAIYLLEDGPDDVAIEPLGRREAVEALVANTYRGRCVGLLNETVRHFQACLTLAGQVPVYRVRRRKDHAGFTRMADTLEAHATALGRGVSELARP